MLLSTVRAIERTAKCTPSSSPSSPKTASGISATRPSSTAGPADPEESHPRCGDTSYMPSRLTSNHFVGRVGELAELELAVRAASASRPTLVLLGGDSGVGKTRLVGELEHRLSAGRDAAPLILRGDGVEQADGELP